MKCSIVFADGAKLNNVIFDNNVYVSPTAVTAEMLNDTALETVEIKKKKNRYCVSGIRWLAFCTGWLR